jgi:Tol biopolymer transport system component
MSGGPATTICDVPGAVPGGTWNSDGLIIFASNDAPGLFRVSASGGVATLLTMVDTKRGETDHRFPQFLPDGRHFLYMRVSSNPEHQGVFSGSIDSKPEQQSITPVMLSNRQGVYIPAFAGSPGQLLFLRETTLFAQPFDPERLKLSGEPIPVTDQVGSFAAANAGLFSVSTTGVLAYRVGTGGDQSRLTWFDTSGKVTSTSGANGNYRSPAISRDGTRIAFSQLDSSNGNSNIWVLDIARGAPGKVTFNSGNNDYPTWSPDGKSIAFASNRRGHMDLYVKNADGTGEERLLLESQEDKTPEDWSRDGRYLVYRDTDPKNSEDIWILPLQGNAKPIPFLRTEFSEGLARFSPDGRWIAYTSTEAGNPEVYVRPFSPENAGNEAAGGKWLISNGGGLFAAWRADGKELFYVTPALQQMAVDVSTSKVFEHGMPRRLFALSLFNRGDVSGDGKRFLYTSPEVTASSPFVVVTNWQARLRR